MTDHMTTAREIIIGVAFVALTVGLFVAGKRASDNFYHASAIEHGCAAYDTVTGEWGWLTKEDER